MFLNLAGFEPTDPYGATASGLCPSFCFWESFFGVDPNGIRIYVNTALPTTNFKHKGSHSLQVTVFWSLGVEGRALCVGLIPWTRTMISGVV